MSAESGKEICFGCPGFEAQDMTEATKSCPYFSEHVDVLDGGSVRWTSYTCNNPQVIVDLPGSKELGYTIEEKQELPK